MIRYGIRQNVEQVVASMNKRTQDARARMERGVKNARPKTDAALMTESRLAFHIKDPRAQRMWRVSVPRERKLTLSITNLMRGFPMHITGGTIGPRRGQAILIPINTRGGTRIGTKKFYTLIAWLRRENLTFVRNGLLWVRVPTNTSRRGGVGVGTRVQKGFRSRFQGSKKRPSGFEILMNQSGSGYSITPIAVVKRSITMKSRINMDRVMRSKIVPLVMESIGTELRR